MKHSIQRGVAATAQIQRTADPTQTQENPYFIYYDQTGSAYNGDLQIEALQVSLFPILPSVTWNFKF